MMFINNRNWKIGNEYTINRNYFSDLGLPLILLYLHSSNKPGFIEGIGCKKLNERRYRFRKNEKTF